MLQILKMLQTLKVLQTLKNPMKLSQNQIRIQEMILIIKTLMGQIVTKNQTKIKLKITTKIYRLNIYNCS